MTRIAVIGAGMGGLVLAQALSSCADVVVFEKARGVGGRMSTRYADPFRFDHGAQFFTARSVEFQAFLKPYIDTQTVSQWRGKVIDLEMGRKEAEHLWAEPHFVASPNMNSLCKALAADLDIRASCEVGPLGQKDAAGWVLHDKNGQALGAFDWVVSTAPPAQTLRLFGEHVRHDAPLHSVNMQGCYTLMLGFNKPWDREWIAAQVQDNPIRWISVNSSKPGRDTKVTCLVAHSANDWAQVHIDADMDKAHTFLLEQLARITGIDASNADYSAVHRWRYAIVDQPARSGSHIDTALCLAATGDWCETSRIEEVWMHANTLAGRIAQALKPT